MKTPREILLQRHRAAAPKLDAIRETVVQELVRPGGVAPAPPANFAAWFLRCFTTPWHELFWSCRRAWAGLAAVWLLLLVFNFAQPPSTPPVLAQATPPAEVRLAFLEQQKLLAELPGYQPPTPIAEPPRHPEKPRSERQPVFMTV